MISVYVNGAYVVSETVQWTSVDPGGFETCNFITTSPKCPITPGQRILILAGLEIAWQGYVEEPGFHEDGGGVARYEVTGVGAGILLKRKTYSMVYIDRDLTRWQPMGSTRRVANLGAGSFGLHDFDITPDTTDGSPRLAMEVDAEWVSTARPLCEAWYDAGSANLIGVLRANWERASNTTSTNWTWLGSLAGDDNASAPNTDTGDLQAEPASTGSFSLSATGRHRFALLQFNFTSAIANTSPAAQFAVWWDDVRVFGDHGLPIAATTGGSDGLRCSDIARHAFQEAGPDLAEGQIDSSIAILHSAYHDPVAPEQVIDDMSLFVGWHWGVWEATSIFDLRPRYFFTAPPTRPTLSVLYEDCQAFDITERLSEMHDSARMVWIDSVGKTGVAESDILHPRLPVELHQELLVQAGNMNQDDAEALLALILASDQSNSRFAGATTLPSVVSQIDRTGEANLHSKLPSYLIRPGRDRIQVIGIPNNVSNISGPFDRIDSFRVKRITVTVEDGTIRTQIEFDAGASLLDTLNAKLDTTQVLAGG